MRVFRWRDWLLGVAITAGIAAPSLTAAQPATSPPPSPPPTTEAVHEETRERQFALGLALLEAGRPREAAVLFSGILARNPNLNRVRLELARAWFMSEQWGRARGEFLSVLSSDIPEPVRDNILRFLRAIDARRGFDWDVDFALVRLGNTRSYESNTIIVNGLPFTINGRDGETTLGLRYALSAEFTQDIPGLTGPDVQALGFGRISLWGEEGSGARFDDMIWTGEPGIRFVWPRTVTSFGPSISRRFVSGRSAEDRIGLQARLSTRTRQGATYTASLGWQHVNHLKSNSRDGHATTLGLTGAWPVTPRVLLGVSLQLADRQARRSSIDKYRRARLTTFGTLDAGSWVTLRPRLYIEQQMAKDPGPAAADETGFGGALTAETDRIVLASGFTPYTTLSARRVNSGIEAFSYWDYSLSFGLERRF